MEDANEELAAMAAKANEQAEPEAGNEPKPTRKRRKKASKKATGLKVEAGKDTAARFVSGLVKKKKREEIERRHDPNAVHFMACPSEHPGIFFTKQPLGAIEPTDWYSTTKEVNQPWPSHIVPCQVCGRTMRMHHTPDGRLIPNRRFLRKLKLEEFESMMREVEREATA